MNSENNVPSLLKQGVRALQAQVDAKQVNAEIDVLVVDRNYALVDLGTMALPSGLYEQESARVFARVPLTFPNAPPYGLVTVPPLARKDGQSIARQHLGHQHARKVQEALGAGNVSFWSWNWKGLPQQKPEDLALVYDWARKRLDQG